VKLSERQRDVLEKMRDGWELYRCSGTFHETWLLKGPEESSSATETGRSLLDKKLICPEQKTKPFGCPYTLTPAGRAAVEEK
jgi:hypothetical protein